MTPAQIIQLCAAHFGVSVEDMTGPSRMKPLPLARALAAHVLLTHEKLSPSETARLIGKHFSTTTSGAHRFWLKTQQKSGSRERAALAAIVSKLDREPQSGVGFTVAVCALHPEEPASHTTDGHSVRLCHACHWAMGSYEREPNWGSVYGIASELLRLEQCTREQERKSA
jgi:hypothetical protein